MAKRLTKNGLNNVAVNQTREIQISLTSGDIEVCSCRYASVIYAV